MTRQARIDYPGAYHHIMKRGFKRELLFEEAEDYEYYLASLDRFKNYEFIVLEYCLMPNHIHLLIKTGPKVRVQKILKSVNTRYALYKSRKRGLPGPIFQGRPKSILVTDEGYLKILGRYILRNPVKAGITVRLSSYKWSSYNLMAKFKTPDWYDNSEITGIFSSDNHEGIKLYKEFIRKPLKEDEKEYPLELFSGIAAGSKEIYENILKLVKKDKRGKQKIYIRKIDWQKRIKHILAKEKLTIDDIKNNKKKSIKLKQKISYIMKEIYHLDTQYIISYLSISQQTLSRYINQICEKIKNNKLNPGSF